MTFLTLPRPFDDELFFLVAINASNHQGTPVIKFRLMLRRFLVIAVLLAPAVRAQQAIVITGAKLIDGSGAPPVEDSMVVIENGRIKAAGRRAAVQAPKDAVKIDASGKTLLPGLIDAHCHFNAPVDDVRGYLAVMLRWGVTTARSVGTDSPEHVAFFHDARDGKFLAPRVYTAGFGFSAPGGSPAVTAPINRPSNEADARGAVRKLAGEKVDFIKIWVERGGGRTPILPLEIRAAIADEARKAGIPIVTHVTAVQDIRDMANLGVTDMMHTPRDSDATPELIALAKSKGLTFTPTFANAEAWHYAENPKLLDDPMLKGAFYPKGWARITDLDLRAKMLADPALAQRKEGFRRSMRFIKTMSDAGVRIATGTDTGAELSPVPFGAATHREIQILGDAGLTPMNAIRAATLDAARVLTRKADPEYGSIAAGKVADLLLVDGDPLADIHNLHRIWRVMRGGKWVQ
jgi:imidazolonepropionase-like amidohydrolase